MARFNGFRLTEMALPAVVWAVHFVMVYSMAGLACEQDWQRSQWAGREIVTWLIGVATLAAWLLLAAIGWIAWRGRHSTLASADACESTHRRRYFMSTLTLALAGVAALAVAMTVIPVALLPTCAG